MSNREAFDREALEKDRKSAFKNLFFSMIPVLFFLVIDTCLGEEYLLYTVIITIIAGGGAFLFELCIRKRFDWINLISMILIVVTGLLSLKFKSKFFILAKPALTEGFLALLMVGSHFLRKPLLLAMNKEFIKSKLPREFEILLVRLNLSLGLSMFPILGVTTYAAWLTSNNQMSNGGYALIKYGLQYGGMIFIMFLELVRIRKWGVPLEEPTGFKKRPSSLTTK